MTPQGRPAEIVGIRAATALCAGGWGGQAGLQGEGRGDGDWGGFGSSAEGTAWKKAGGAASRRQLLELVFRGLAQPFVGKGAISRS